MENKVISDKNFNKNNLEQLRIKYWIANNGQSKLASPGMKYIPAGELILGSKKEPDNPKHKVTLANAFEIGEHLVTSKEFFRFCPEKIKEVDKDNAMTNISLRDAYNYCKWLSLNADDIPDKYKEEIKKLPDVSDYYFEYAWNNPQARLYRLPSEAEWEYACRIDKFKMESYKDPDSKLINIWEWCMDYYDDYQKADGSPTIFMLPDFNHSIRGVIKGLSIAARSSSREYLHYNNVGMRIVRSRP